MVDCRLSLFCWDSAWLMLRASELGNIAGGSLSPLMGWVDY